MSRKRERLKYIAVLLVIGLFSIYSVSHFNAKLTGNAVVNSEAGTITYIDVSQKYKTGYWQGYYGLELFLSGYNEQQTDNAEPANIEEKHLVFGCLEPGKTHEVYATPADPATLNWNTVRAGTTAMVDQYQNLTSNISDSATATFTYNVSFEVGVNNITAPSAYTLQYGNSTSTLFAVGILNVSGNHVMVTKKMTSITNSYKGSSVNYQFMVPLPNLTKLYYFVADPFDDCPDGLGTGLTGDGIVKGTIRDNETGLAIFNVSVSVAGGQTYTNSTGDYNITVNIGTFTLVAAKSDYITYFSDVNISLGETLNKSFNMSTFTGYKQPNGTITGFARDNSSGLGISGATVSVLGMLSTTNGSGYYIMNATGGSQSLVATKTAYSNYVNTVNITPNATMQHNFTMVRSEGTVDGIITDADSASPVSDATILIGGKTTTTDATGYYIMNVSPGQHSIIINKTLYEAHAALVNIIPGNTTRYDASIRLLIGYVYGYVRDIDTQTAIVNATVSIAGSSTLTNGSGFYNLSSTRGNTNIISQKSDYSIYASNVTIIAGTNLLHDINMTLFIAAPVNGTIRGYVTDNETNQSISGVEISINGRNTTTNGSGYYIINSSSGSHYLIAIKYGYDGYYTFLQVLPGSTIDRNISMTNKFGKGQSLTKVVISNISANVNLTLNSLNILNFSNETIDYNSTVTINPNKNISNVSFNSIVYSVIDVFSPDAPVVQRYYEFTSNVINDSDINNITYNISYADKNTPTNFNETYFTAYYYNTSRVDWDRVNSTVNTESNTVSFLVKHLSLYVIGLKTGNIIGNVTSDSGDRLTNALVSIGGVSNLSISQGFYQLNKVSAGANTVLAFKSGYGSYTNATEVNPDATSPHNITLSVASVGVGNGTLSGVVKDESGSAVESATVSIAGKTLTTSLAGTFLTNLSEGKHVLVASKTGYENFIGNATILTSQTTSVNITMSIFVPAAVGQAATEGGQGQGSGEKTVSAPQVLRQPTKPVDFELSVERISAKIRKGTFSMHPIVIQNLKKAKVDLIFSVDGNVNKLSRLSRETMSIDPESQGRTDLTILANTDPGVYNGSLKIDGDIKKTIPIEVLVYSEERLPVEALIAKLSIVEKNVLAGSQIKYRVELQNLLQEEGFNVRVSYNISDRGNYSVWLGSDDVYIKTTSILVKNSPIPSDIPSGDYVLVMTVDYFDTSTTHTAFFKVSQPIYKYAFWGVPVWTIFVATGLLATATFGTVAYKKRKYDKKRYKAQVNLGKIPKEGPRGLTIGMVSDTTTKAVLDMDQLQLHTVVSGSSGSGKSMAAQVLIEEALARGISVLVFDPTAQWTGFLRPNKEKKLLSLYPSFGMKPSSARPFNGNIRMVSDENEELIFKKTMKRGEITILVTKNLDNLGNETIIANTIDHIFAENMPEEKEIRYIVVIDGIHNLLPKFGGSGKVFVKIERAVREFRKWGIGIMIVSQTTGDFSDEIRGNLNTQVMLRVRDEKDMAIIKEHYGNDVLLSLIKADLGAAMVQNSQYNEGKPYFVQFRPVMHDVNSLSDDDLTAYSKYNEITEDMDFQIEQLEKLNVDVFDLKLGVKMVSDKVKAGNFGMADIYIDDLKNNFDAQWKKIGKTPEPRRKTKVVQPTPQEQPASAPKQPAQSQAPQAPPASQAQQSPVTPNAQAVAQRMEILLNGAQTSIDNKNFAEGMGRYAAIQKMYTLLPPEDKAAIAPRCTSIAQSLMRLRNGQA